MAANARLTATNAAALIALLAAEGATILRVRQLISPHDRRMLAPAAQLIALVKPTFELHAATLADQPQQVAAAAQTAARALEDHGWHVLGQQPSPLLGAKGAVEVFIHATSGLQAQ